MNETAESRQAAAAAAVQRVCAQSVREVTHTPRALAAWYLLRAGLYRRLAVDLTSLGLDTRAIRGEVRYLLDRAAAWRNFA